MVGSGVATIDHATGSFIFFKQTAGAAAGNRACINKIVPKDFNHTGPPNSVW